MAVTGTPRFNQLAVGEIEVDFTSSPIKIDVTAAFVDSKTGETHGWTKGYGGIWSEETRKKLVELRELMELDLSKLHFDKAGSATTTKGVEFEPGGISEHLDKDAQQV